MWHSFPTVGEDAVDANTAYHLLTALIVPRPIAWVSTLSATGVDNLAPHSFFTVSSRTPPVVQFTSVGENDTLKNIRETHEFVINASPAPLMEQINMSGTDYPREVSEFDEVGVTRQPSKCVSPPRVGESPSALECVLHSIIEVGDSWLVLGNVVHVTVRTDVTVTEGERIHPVFDKLDPLSRLGRDEWGAPGPTRSIKRLRYSKL